MKILDKLRKHKIKIVSFFINSLILYLIDGKIEIIKFRYKHSFIANCIMYIMSNFTITYLILLEMKHNSYKKSKLK